MSREGHEQAAEAIVLGGVDYGDSDRVITLLTREKGRVAAFAAGARKSKRRFAGALEPFTRLSVRMTERRGGDLHFLASCEILEANAGLRLDLGRLAHAGHAAELCRELCREREPHEELFDRLSAYLTALAAAEAAPEDLLAFELAALSDVGVAPRFSDCTVCGAPVQGEALFDPPHGGVLCGGCIGQAFPGAVRADAEALAAGAALQTAGPCAGLRIEDARLRGRVRSLVRRFTHHTLGRSPRSLEFLAQVGIEG